ncbi:hypothetical protein ACFQ2M_35320 [Kitasatospora saccharophila]
MPALGEIPQPEVTSVELGRLIGPPFSSCARPAAPRPVPASG